MKVRRLIELLQKVSPDAEVMGCILTGDLAQLTNMPLLKTHKNYEIFLLTNNDDYICRLLLKKGGY